MRRSGSLVLAVVVTVLMLTAGLVSAPPEGQPRFEPAATQVAGSGQAVIAHRGASGYRPEHTLEAYELAARMGADYLEPDLVATADGVLVARHENEIGQTTDVAERPEFADRETTKIVEGEKVTGWFTEDFTLAELKTLRATTRLPDLRENNTIYDGRYEVPTYQEIIDLAAELSRELNRPIGTYPETKHPSYFDSIGLPLEPELVRVLERNGLNRPSAPVYVQSFEVGSLRKLSEHVRVPLVQLIAAEGAPYDFIESGEARTYDDLVTPEGLEEIAGYADGIGPAKDRVIPRDADGYLDQPTSLVADAHAEGLVVHPWTFRNENAFLPEGLRTSDDDARYGHALDEYEAFLDTGIDGMFTDHPDTAVAARDEDR
ncbi:glycerophosphodiester phosphodiesterase [Haloechinothrix sp. LS1_15]|uniref:glycerophosphodiester phosphodiesterase n=1 Tax=Haloechinothrix sp. LS1_15 TaxID=2652248 RepID=UPI0029482C83|nr:glycerophosphodiester phosphodiesterase [Haloechinothrix sp. LS1_15]MDV6014653.1 glycerophosphodiester phosphodiesterase [Haloechinothrix sp. LS1_15]